MEVTTRNGIGHNTHCEGGILQYGGTAMTSFDLLAPQVLERGSDNYGLDRWIYMRWETPEGKRTRIIS